MKRYIKIIGDEIYATDEITKKDLAYTLHGHINLIIDLKYGTFFNAKENHWDNFKTE